MDKDHPSRRILVVDDNADAADLVAQLLTLKGHEVATAHSGEEALAAAIKFSPEVVFLDLGMPKMDGYQVAAALRSAARFSSTRIVALTAWGNAKARARTAANGFDALLLKPACLETLMSQTALPRFIH